MKFLEKHCAQCQAAKRRAEAEAEAEAHAKAEAQAAIEAAEKAAAAALEAAANVKSECAKCCSARRCQCQLLDIGYTSGRPVLIC